MALEHFVETALFDGGPDGEQGFYAASFSPNGRYIFSTHSRHGYWTLDRVDESYTTAFNASDGAPAYNGAAIDNDGTVYAIVAGDGVLYRLDNFAQAAPVLLNSDIPFSSVTFSMRLFVMPNASKKVVWLGNDTGTGGLDVFVYDIGAGTMTTVANSTPGPNTFAHLVQDSYGDVWAVTTVALSGKLYFQRVVDGGAGSSAPDYNEIAGFPVSEIGSVEAYHSSAGWFVCFGGGTDLYLLDTSNFSTLAHRSYAVAGSFLNAAGVTQEQPFLMGLAAGEDSFWFPGPASYANYTYSDLYKINAADLTTIATHDVSDWAIGDDPDEEGMVFSTHTRMAVISQSRGGDTIEDFTTVIRYFPDAADETEGGESDTPQFRVWSFSLDGHDFAVFRVGASLSLIYDLTTGQWAQWQSPDRNNWRAHVGCNWVGMSADTFARGFGSDVVAGDDATGILWILDPVTGLDDTTTTGSTTYPRTVIGGIPLGGREAVRCGAVQLTASLGNPALTGSSVVLRTSDDFGHSYQSHGALTVTAGSYDQVLEWRACGLMRQPGRIFEISDDGITRISALEYR